MKVGEFELKPCVNLADYYVYVLIDPRTDAVFYVGKGKGRRVYSHVIQWRKGLVVNKAKHERIGAIIKSGFEIKYGCVIDGVPEDISFSIENKLIKTIGLENLTNYKPGYSEPEKIINQIMDLFRRLRPHWRWEKYILPQLLNENKELTAEWFEKVNLDVLMGLFKILIEQKRKLAIKCP